MNIEYHKWWSPALGHDMELKIYGHWGKPVLVFPAAGGKFYEYEDFGMVEACRPFIEAGKIKIFTIDSIDNQSWLNHGIHPVDRANRHDDYERYVLEEVVPFIHNHCHSSVKIMTTGCSMGAYHALNFLLRHPEAFDAVISLSGVYAPGSFVGDYMDEKLYFYFPTVYLPGLDNAWYLDQFRQSQIILCVGQGPWEQAWNYDCIGDTRAVKAALDAKNVPCWADFWGYDVNHDWVWWRVQMPYFLGKMSLA